MPVSLKFNKLQKKSISLPCRSHPTTVRIEEELSKIKTCSSTTPSADNICKCINQIVELHHVTENLLVSPRTRKLIALHRDAMWVADIMDASMKLLDICGHIRDIVLQMQEHVRDLQCVLRRRDRANHMISMRKKMKKDLKEVVMSLKQYEKVTGVAADGGDDHHLTAVVRVLMEVTEVTFAIFASVMIYVSSPVSKWNGWSLAVSKVRHRGCVSCKLHVETYGGMMKEIESLEGLLVDIRCNGEDEMQQSANIRLEGVQERMLRLESGLECVYRVLVKTRASLLNVMSL